MRRSMGPGFVKRREAPNAVAGGDAVLTRDELLTIMPHAANVADRVLGPLDTAMTRFEIRGPARQAAFLAQLAHESGELRHWSESLNYSWQRLRQVFPKYFKTDAEARAFDRQEVRIANRVYGGRMGNGPEDSGDGWRYRGRGPIQLTGKNNYRACGAGLGLDLLARPDLLETPETGCLAAGWFWVKNGLNALADAGDFVSITRRINGGLVGLDKRRAFWERAKEVLGISRAPAIAAEAAPTGSGGRPRGAPSRWKPAARRAKAPGRGRAPVPAKASKRAPSRPKRSSKKRRAKGTASRRRRGTAKRARRR
jgi:putative chitinase